MLDIDVFEIIYGIVIKYSNAFIIEPDKD